MLTIKCAKHPRYKAILKPRCRCTGCWQLWSVAHGGKVLDLDSKLTVVRETA